MLQFIPLAGMGIYGVYKAISGAVDGSEANSMNAETEDRVSAALRKTSREHTLTQLVLRDYGARKLRAFNGVIEDFLLSFERLKNVEAMDAPVIDGLLDMESAGDALKGLGSDYQLLKASGLGLGAGLTGGAALAFGAYNGTMALAAASTGTAISTLSGAAATNATLAWLGGGSLAAGGGGVAMGSMVLGGIVAAPALAICGYIMGKKGDEALANARTNEANAATFVEEMALLGAKLVAIQEVGSLANHTFSKISGLLRRKVHELNFIIEAKGGDYQTYGSGEREVVFLAVKLAQLLKALIDLPLLDEDGNLLPQSSKQAKEIGVAAGVVDEVEGDAEAAFGADEAVQEEASADKAAAEQSATQARKKITLRRKGWLDW